MSGVQTPPNPTRKHHFRTKAELRQVIQTQPQRLVEMLLVRREQKYSVLMSTFVQVGILSRRTKEY